MNSDTDGKLSRKSTRDICFALITIISSVLLCLLVAEYSLRWYQQSINNSSASDPGLLRYHPRLGWTLTPSWQGRHQHHDFDVRYNINRHGFRGHFPVSLQHKTKPRIVIVGDSFSFGLGVNDADTFTAKLNQRQTGVDFLNLSIPGYSTDQQLLLVEATGNKFDADEYLLMIYLANDILDNMLSYPLQTEQAKPFFSLDEKRNLVLQNVPTPNAAKPATLRSMTLNTVIFGERLQDYETSSILQGSQLWQRLLPRKAKADKDTVFKILDQRLSEQKLLMKALLEKMHKQASAHNRRLRLGLLSGSSFILAPESYSAYFQDYVRLFLRDIGNELEIPVIDVADSMRMRKSAESSTWFYPHEGHLTAQGNLLVSDILADALKLNWQPPH